MSRRKHRNHAATRPDQTVSLHPAQMALLLALAALPALFNIQSSVSFEPDKAAMLISLAIVALIDLLWRAWRARPAAPAPALKRILRTPANLLLAGLVAWAILISLAAIDPATSLWGNYDRGYGLLTLLAGVIFLIVARNMTQAGEKWLLVDAAIIGAAIPILYGFIQMLALDPVRGIGVSFPLGQRASSTLGNPLYLGDYLLLVIGLILARRLLHPPATALGRRILEAAAILALGLLILTFSRSVYLGLAVAGLSLLLFWWNQQRTAPMPAAKSLRSSHPTGPSHAFASKLLLPAILFAAIVGITLLILLWPKLQHGGTLQQRLLIWQAVIDLARARPRILLAGLGFDALSLALAPHLPPTLAHFEPDFVFRIPDRAHSLPLDLLVAGGLPWLLGWLAVAGMALWRLWRSHKRIAVWLAALIIGRGVLLLASFPTHAPDLLFWVVLGMSFGLGKKRDFQGLADFKSFPLLFIASFGVFGFSLSAAWPGGLFLWLLATPPLVVLLYALSPTPPFAHARIRSFTLTLLILPAILLNQHIGPAAMLAWIWLLLWLTTLALSLPWPITDWTSHGLKFVIIALLLLLITIPRLGDIAYKSALLAPDSYHRDIYLAKALSLAPYDHVMAAGVAWVDAQRLRSTADAPRITQLYLLALNAQPLAPEPAAALARWLARLAKTDPRQTSQAQDAFNVALARSPNDIQTLNAQAMLWAQTGRPDDAIAELQRLLTLDPLYAPTYRNLAQVYRQIDDEDAAQAILQQGREQVPWWSGWGS